MSYVTNAGWDATYQPDLDESGPDECIAREDDARGESGRRCTCGFAAALHDDYYGTPPDIRHDDFPGCRGCDPVDHECKPSRLGMELWEYAPRMAERARIRDQYRGFYCRLPAPHEEIDAAGDAVTPLRVWRLARAAARAWDRICDEAETHREAVRLYKEWAAKVARTTP